ncbi:hypothetical protein DM860_017817 [Cuscuta australis]|uniref:Uncharacterized protein n=1 Tax=Cuscuta australis TaxID=267555 RepID=A0A328DYE5_9ASTE|nr:hypothetical protein DM860_017817 [Cuscuta australis]
MKKKRETPKFRRCSIIDTLGSTTNQSETNSMTLQLMVIQPLRNVMMRIDGTKMMKLKVMNLKM